jgi:TonB-dependent SusC/RagA subfamily outer membrane receptor
MRKLIILFVVILFTVSLSAQNRVVYGNVRAFENLNLANIIVSAQKAGTKALTDSLGNFNLVCNGKDVLEFYGKTFYMTKKRVNSKTDKVNVMMEFIKTDEKDDNVALAVGYGYISKQNATHAYSEIQNNKKGFPNFCSYSNIYDLIKETCPEVTVSNGSILIRGKKSFSSSNSAIYVVDDIVTDQISQLLPCDIKSISILKDEATTIYGSRGANGVVLIQTRKGNE